MTLSRITHDPALMGGRPCIWGLRITVATVLNLMARGSSRELSPLAPQRLPC